MRLLSLLLVCQQHYHCHLYHRQTDGVPYLFLFLLVLVGVVVMAVIAAVLAPRLPTAAADYGTGPTWLVRRASHCPVVVAAAARRIGQACVQQGTTAAAAVAFFVDKNYHFCETVFGPRGVLFGVP